MLATIKGCDVCWCTDSYCASAALEQILISNDVSIDQLLNRPNEVISLEMFLFNFPKVSIEPSLHWNLEVTLVFYNLEGYPDLCCASMALDDLHGVLPFPSYTASDAAGIFELQILPGIFQDMFL